MTQPNRLEIPLPPKDQALRLAKQMAGGNLLRLRILQALIARPQRYAELRPLHSGSERREPPEGVEPSTC